VIVSESYFGGLLTTFTASDLSAKVTKPYPSHRIPESVFLVTTKACCMGARDDTNDEKSAEVVVDGKLRKTSVEDVPSSDTRALRLRSVLGVGVVNMSCKVDDQRRIFC